MLFFKFKKINNFLLICTLMFLGQVKFSLAQENVIVNPLNNNFEHQLLPSIKRNLTPLEQKRVRERITELDVMAKQELVDENIDQAFVFWYEAINLSRFLDLNTEMETIMTAGAVAWEQRRSQDLEFLQARLLILEQENSQQNQLNPEVLPLFIKAYDVLHSIDKSIVLHQQNLVFAQANNDDNLVLSTSEKLGKLYLAKFDYYSAQPIYEKLLEIARSNQDYLSESIYLQKLAEISQALVNPDNSVDYKKQLAQNFLNDGNVSELARLRISIGNDYQALDNPQSASEFYQSAFALALSLEQFAIAGDALKQLGQLYQKYEQFDSALLVYQELVKIESNSYNFYGLMNTYDFIGTIYTQKQDYLKALTYFRMARAIAFELKYKEDYFEQKISQVETIKSEQ